MVHCAVCALEFKAKPSDIARGRGRFCSRACFYARAIVHKPVPVPLALSNPHLRWYYRVRDDVLSHYSPERKCALCGFQDMRALSLDHMAGDGAAHRRDLGSRSIYAWVKRSGYPLGFRVLCMNCQFLTRPNLAKKPTANTKAFRARKALALEAYSPGGIRCALCSYSDPTALTIDHIAGGGVKHRTEIARTKGHKTHSGSTMYLWLREQGWPSGYRVLCMNCQWIEKWKRQREARGDSA